MLPTINIFGMNIPSYGISAIFGIALAVIYIWLRVRRRKDIDRTQLINIPAVAFIGAFIGAHILYGITHLDKLWWCIMHLDKVFSSWENFWFYTTDIWGGMVFYGGLIGGIILGTIYCKKQKARYNVLCRYICPCDTTISRIWQSGLLFGWLLLWNREQLGRCL